MREDGTAHGAWHGSGVVSAPLIWLRGLLCQELGGEIKDAFFGRIDSFLPGPPSHSLLGMEN